jgi:hypothetical protein
VNPAWRVTSSPTPPRTGAYTQLADVARKLGVEYRGDVELRAAVNGAPVCFSLDINSGTVVGVLVRVELEGAPRVADDGPVITLRRETATDREGKRRGINRELQTGNEGFDAAVYVDSQATDSETRRVLGRSATREAVQGLLTSACHEVRVTRRVVEGKWTNSADVFGAAPLLDALELLLVVARGGGPRTRGHGARRAAWLPWALGLVATGSPVLLGWCAFRWTAGWALPLVGGALGFAAGLATRPALARLVSGDAGSFGRYRVSAVLWVVTLMFVGPAFLLAVNGAFDAKPPVVRRGVAVAVGPVDDESGRVTATVKWSDGATDELRMDEGVQVGAPVTQVTHAGRLGVTWHEATQRAR